MCEYVLQHGFMMQEYAVTVAAVAAEGHDEYGGRGPHIMRCG